MATTNTTPDLSSHPGAQTERDAGLLVSLPSLPPDSLQATLAHLTEAFPGRPLLVTTPDGAQTLPSGSSLRVVPYTPVNASASPWVLAAADFVNAYELAQKNQAQSVLLLGGETQSLSVDALRSLAMSVEAKTDLTVACYDLGPREGLVNSAILYPVTRALYGVRPRFPLAVDLGLSLRMAEKLATVAGRYTAGNQPDALLWPVAEAALAGFSIQEVEAGARVLPPPAGLDLNGLLGMIAGSLFADVDAKAAFWQRARNLQPRLVQMQTIPPNDAPADVKPMLDTFRLAYTNLHELWSLVLPPASLLGLKRLSQAPPNAFRMPDALWARIVYDFILAYRLRTLNRGHLLGALTPLYLAWVASHLQLVDTGVAPEKHIETLATAFEADKPYLVSRWRWPDRFNP
ncbi:hypothetical protein SAMN05421770_105228 [Granulicella rosea]|uniref:Uncharacterized protein n=1 Tax=Granulicella rosea TaxID=474952 RepID=A0A239KW93_9BACT|nr:hypothetical protein [Granulicella rosea]SNT21908.1 hypothetical protein SAMN05421770_105228 [Granulicella rosea]